MPGPGLYVALAVIGVVVLVVAQWSRRQAMAERVDAPDDPGKAEGHSDHADGSHVQSIGMDPGSYIDRHHGWTGGRS
jgi:hypothetical protein